MGLIQLAKKAGKAVDDRPALKYGLMAAPMVINTVKSVGTYFLTQEIRFNSEMVDYEPIARYIANNIINEKFSRTYGYEVEERWDRVSDEETLAYHGISLGYGKHYGRYKGVVVIVHRYMSEKKGGPLTEHVDVTFLTRKKAIVKSFAEDVRSEVGTARKSEPKVSIYINTESWWNRMGKLPLRKISSVITRNDVGQQMVDAVREFESKKDEHHEQGLPHHMGIMLHGVPGCGKSSLLHAVASALGRSIYYLNLGSVTKDSELTGLLSGTLDWSKAILALEDVDAAGVKVNRDGADGKEAPEAKSPVSMSAILNVLDGMLCPDGLVVVATTNHYERIDAALKREGRFDYTFELGTLGYDDFLKMAVLLRKDAADFPMKPGDEMTGAAMRAMLLGIAR